MMTFEEFYSHITPKFDGWLWADYEAKFFGDDLYIKASTDFTYYHHFDLYIKNAKATNIVEDWTVDLRYQQILEVRDGGLYFATDDPPDYPVILVEGTEFFASVDSVYYWEIPTADRPWNTILNGAYFSLADVDHVYDLDRFERLILE